MARYKSAAVPKFGIWNDDDPQSAKNFNNFSMMLRREGMWWPGNISGTPKLTSHNIPMHQYNKNQKELDGLADPMKKEVAVVRKKIDTVNKELKPLGQTCQKKEKEYKEALEAFNDKNEASRLEYGGIVPMHHVDGGMVPLPKCGRRHEMPPSKCGRRHEMLPSK
ncbi:unnamed protein product [Fraxinus pennsylvanica]|uniref:RIN4 pathogenic type III effector avirulence factor Avr cleavage site domain-containing protein n=1 Tax=Fraxinus pennsylvanica TaxID=56036 RepID=A0AAD2AGD6_9LAMI|nr:unnamed protein product [Fraxinus pennsylvanica]